MIFLSWNYSLSNIEMIKNKTEIPHCQNGSRKKVGAILTCLSPNIKIDSLRNYNE
jgi:hypothetical protein